MTISVYSSGTDSDKTAESQHVPGMFQDSKQTRGWWCSLPLYLILILYPGNTGLVNTLLWNADSNKKKKKSRRARIDRCQLSERQVQPVQAGSLWDLSLATIIPRWAKLSDHHPQICPWITHTPERYKLAITWFWVAIACNRNEHKIQIADTLWHSGFTAPQFRSALLVHSNSWALWALRSLWIHLSCEGMEEVSSLAAPWWHHGQISAS